jgi:hypothetical protein
MTSGLRNVNPSAHNWIAYGAGNIVRVRPVRILLPNDLSYAAVTEEKLPEDLFFVDKLWMEVP